MHDDDRLQRTRTTDDFLETHEVAQRKWPAVGLDLNPIITFTGESASAMTLVQLRQVLIEECEAIP